jgi:hypothetical protein
VTQTGFQQNVPEINIKSDMREINATQIINAVLIFALQKIKARLDLLAVFCQGLH